MKRIVIFLLEIVAALVVCLFIGLGLLMARLEQGPFALKSALPTIESALSDLSPGLKFKIDSAHLQLSQEHRALQLQLDNIHLFNKDGQEVGNLEEVTMGFNWRNLTGFTAMPVALEMLNPNLIVTRFSNGSTGFNLQKVAPDAAHAASISDLTNLISHLPHGIRHVEVTGAELRYDDQEAKTSFAAHNGLLDFNRVHDQVSGTMNLDIDAGDFKQRIQGTIVQDTKTGDADLIVALKDFRLDQARNIIPGIPADLKLDMPLDILLTTTIVQPLKISDIQLQLTGKTGTLQYAPYFPQALPISEMFGKMDYIPAERRVHLQSFGVNLEKTTILAVGNLTKTANEKDKTQNDLNISLKALAENVPVDKLPLYWPQGAAVHARDWVTTHIHSGMAQRGVINVSAMIDPDKNATIKDMKGRIDFTDASLDYLPPMPQIDHINGQCRFTDKNFDVAVTSGQTFDTKVVTGTTQISDLLGDNPAIVINAETNGPIRDALTTISSKPLEYAQKIGMVPDNFTGTTNTKLMLSFPLLEDLKLDQVHIDLSATLQDLTAKNIVKDLTVSGKSLALKIDDKGLTLDGDAQLADASSHVTWHEFFAADSEFNTTVDTNGTITPAMLVGLRLPAQDYFKGSAKAETHITIDKNKTTNIAAKADLANAEITEADIALQKKAGIPGQLDLKLSSDAKGTTTITDSSVSWKDFSIANAAVQIGADNMLQSANLKDVRMGRSKAELSVTPTGPNAVKAIVKADTLDLSGYWTKKKTIGEKPSTQRVDLDLTANTLFLYPDVPLKNVRAKVVANGSDLHSGLVSAQGDDGATLALQQTESKDNSRHLAIKVNNAGRILQALDVTQAVHGGTLTVIGDSTPKNPSVIEGKIVMEKFTMLNAPVMARMLNALSPGGLLHLLGTSGLTFSKLESDYSLPDPKTIKVSKGKMSGDSMGLSFGGTIDREANTLAINGTIIPIEGINKLANIIPVLGKVLTGLNGNGIFAATYSITGPSANPNVSVNPLSALTPGILRSIFFESSDD